MSKHAKVSNTNPRDAKAKEPANSSEPNWTVGCSNCGSKPTVGKLALCGPCCFGEAETAGGNW